MRLLEFVLDRYNKAAGEPAVITFRISVDIKDDRRVVLTLPSEVPTGQTELIVTVEQSSSEDKLDLTGPADWVEERSESNGDMQARYPLRGSVVRYEQPTEPVAEGDWEALR
jgi:hypothetical protein